MIRRALVVLLLIAGVGSILVLSRSAGPRGAKFTLYEEPGWSGKVLKTWQSKHLDNGNRLRRNKFAIPEGSSLRASAWIYIPRRGVYQFEVESTDDNWLYIDDTLVCSNRGDRKPKPRSRELTRGFHALRLDTHHKKGDHKTLVRWKLPAGYMELEAIPPFFMRPDEPSSAPLPWMYRLMPLTLFGLALLLGVGPGLSRRWRRIRRNKGYRLEVVAGLAVFLLALGVRIIDLNGAGETCDEWAYATAGQIYAANTAHGYFQSTYWNSNDEHPPVGKYIYGLAAQVTGTDDFEVLRFTSALLNALTVLMTFLIGLQLFNLPTAFTSALILSLLPHFIAHGKVAGLDSPSAFFYTLTVALFLSAARRQHVSNRAYFLAGIVACLAFATKFSNATVFIFMVAVYLYREWPDLRSKGTMRLPVSLYLLPVLPLLILFLIWPWLWREPFGQLVKTLSHWNYPISEWFLGSYRQPPLYYYPVYLVATVPAALFVPLTMFFIRFRKASDAARTDAELTTDTDATADNAERLRTWQASQYIVLFWFLSSLLWSFSSFKQDGIRYIYTAIPALALMAGAGLQTLVRRRNWWPASWVAVTVYLTMQISTVHPYYLDYYNELVGGTETVWENRLLEVGWWGEGIPEAVAHVNKMSHYGATWSQRGVVTHTFHGLRDDLIAVEKNPDYLIWSNIRPEEKILEGYDIDFEVTVDDAPIAVVFIKASTLKEMRLGLDPTDNTDTPYSDLGQRAQKAAEEALKKSSVAPKEPEAEAPAPRKSDDNASDARLTEPPTAPQ